MMKSAVILVLIILFSTFVYADLEQFPANFFSGDQFDGYIVVGKDGTALDVLGQNAIAMKVNLYAGVPQSGIIKVDNEVDLDNNLILIGNPCVNMLVNELLEEPSPCDKDFPAGKAYIRYYSVDGYEYIVAAGNDAEGNKKAADYLADFDRNGLTGDEVEIDVEVEEDPNEEGGMPPSGVVAPPPVEDDVVPVLINEEDEEIVDDVNGGNLEEETDSKIIVKDRNIFEKFWDWLEELFS
jgi:hypothetical protein